MFPVETESWPTIFNRTLGDDRAVYTFNKNSLITCSNVSDEKEVAESYLFL